MAVSRRNLFQRTRWLATLSFLWLWSPGRPNVCGRAFPDVLSDSHRQRLARRELLQRIGSILAERLPVAIPIPIGPAEGPIDSFLPLPRFSAMISCASLEGPLSAKSTA